jgi:large subunit ribosomal protein L9
MKILLLEDVLKIGGAGEVKNVADGYARNYLLPKKLALPATEGNLKKWESEKRVREVKAQATLDTTKKLAADLENIAIEIPARAGKEGHLFGSITNQMVAAALLKKGFSVDKKNISLETHIKTLGEHQAQVRLHSQVTANLKIQVVPTADSAPQETAQATAAQ